MSYADDYLKAKEKGKTTQVTKEIFTWDEEGEQIIGRVLEVSVFTGGKFESKSMQYTIDTDNGIVTTVLGTATDKQLKDKNLVGKVIFIEYGGKIELGDGRQVNRFKVEVW